MDSSSVKQIIRRWILTTRLIIMKTILARIELLLFQFRRPSLLIYWAQGGGYICQCHHVRISSQEDPLSVLSVRCQDIRTKGPLYGLSRCEERLSGLNVLWHDDRPDLCWPWAAGRISLISGVRDCHQDIVSPTHLNQDYQDNHLRSTTRTQMRINKHL